jgi:nickel-dependent lactate racemase
MRVDLAYGTAALTVDLPDGSVVRPRHTPPVGDVATCLRTALREPVAGPPLGALLRPGARVAISICDLTRPQPRRAMLHALLDEFRGIVADADVTVLVATGTHRGNTSAELRRMLGDLVDRLEVVNHDARDRASLTWCGTHGAGVPTWLNRRWVEADIRITTGFVEPHFFAGFSGGPKLVAPGLAGLDTVLVLHDAARIGDPRATWAVCEGNPVHDDIRAIAAGTGVSYAFDVVLDAKQRITAAFGGEVLAMHAAARDHVRSTAMVAVPERFDVVVTTNSGFPLDQNLYQAVKGMSAAATIVRPGGWIVAAAECRDGFPDHGDFRAELAGADDPHALLARIAARHRTVPDQWQVQVLARVLATARVGLHSTGLSADDVAAAHLVPVPDISAFVSAALRDAATREGRPATLCVLPEGPQTVPYVVDGT